ncbi:MAG: DUF1854 domain-containing protein [Planctomycetes bacterium]|nr:DUF1854 domain-containing protein [Planctomycetota bacterium]
MSASDGKPEAAATPSLSAAAILRQVGVTYLTPDSTEIYKGTFSLMHVAIRGPESNLFRGVFAVRAFPVSQPNRFISLRYVDVLDNKEHEIGVIEDLSVFSTEAQKVVRDALRKQYYEAEITRILAIRWQFNLLFFEVETTLGRQEFMMRWSYDRAQSFGDDGKVLLDVFENRYVIPDVSKLPQADSETFQRYIYW